MNTYQEDTLNTLSSACDSVVDLLMPGRLPTNFEDVEEEAYMKALELEMEIESDLYADDLSDQFEVPESPLEIRSLVQLPGSSQNSAVWVHTKTGRRAKIILEAQDESENVGLLEYEDQTQEIRRLSSYANKKNSTTTMTPRNICRADSLAVPNLGGGRIPSMRTGKNPHFDPRQSELIQSPCAFKLPSMRAGKNPHFSPSAAVFF